MKKVLSIVLALLMLVAAIACTAPAQQPQTTTEAPQTEPVTEAPKTEPEPEPEPVKAEPVTALGLCIKNKSGFAVDALYIYPTGGETGNSVVEKGWPTKDVDKNAFEKNIYIVRPEGAELSVLAVLEDGNTIAQDVGVLENYTEIELDGLTVECEKEDDPEDQALIDEVIAIGKTADGFLPEVTTPVAETTAEYTALGLKFKNKSGVVLNEVYIYADGDEKGANVLTLNGPMPAEENEIVLYLFRETAKLDKMVVEIVYAEGDPFVWKLTGPLGNNYKLTVKTQAELDDWKNELIEKEKDLTKIAEFVAECEANGTTSDGFRP